MPSFIFMLWPFYRIRKLYCPHLCWLFPFCSHILSRILSVHVPPSALHYRKLSFTNCGLQTSQPTAFWLGSANGRHWERLEGREREKSGCFSLSLLQETSRAVTATSPWLQLLPERPFHLRSLTHQAVPPSIRLPRCSPSRAQPALPIPPGKEVVAASCTF